MSLSHRESILVRETAKESARLVLSELERRGWTGPDSPKGLAGRMTTSMVADALGGVCHQTVRRNWRAWGLRRLGRGRNGWIFCGASVARHISQQQQSNDNQL